MKGEKLNRSFLGERTGWRCGPESWDLPEEAPKGGGEMRPPAPLEAQPWWEVRGSFLRHRAEPRWDIGETAWLPGGEQDNEMGQLMSCHPNSLSQIELLAADRGTGEMGPYGVLWKVGMAPTGSHRREAEMKPGNATWPKRHNFSEIA